MTAHESTKRERTMADCLQTRMEVAAEMAAMDEQIRAYEAQLAELHAAMPEMIGRALAGEPPPRPALRILQGGRAAGP